MERPKLRNVAVSPIEHEGRQHFVISDPTGAAPEALVVAPLAMLILQHLDGQHDLREVQWTASRALGRLLPLEQLEELVRSLDRAGYLEGPAFQARLCALIEGYRSAPCRPPVFAGEGYPADEAGLRSWLETLGGEPAAPAAARGRLVGLVAPHIDLRFGGASCKLVHAERARRAGDAETVVVLGTGHGAGEELFVLTRQSYGTPLGVLPTDLELVEALVARLGEQELLGAEILHAREHSVEFQALFLHLFTAPPAAPPRLLPVLVGSFEPFIRSGTEPYADPRVCGFVEGLRAELVRLGRRACFAASIDLSHLGPRYGDARGLSPQEAAQIEAEDRQLLAFAEQGDAEGFFRHHQASGDRRRVCGFAPLYVLLRLLPGARGRLLRYDQSTFPGTADTVAHCAMLFEE